MLDHEGLKERALTRAEVRREYNKLEEEFGYLDQFLRARAAAGLTQADLAKKMGTTQSAIARLETGKGRHSPSLATLKKYAQALGCRIELRLVTETNTNRDPMNED